jgi:ankyrin repeat protein
MANNSEKSIFKLLNKYLEYSTSNLEKVDFRGIFKDFVENGGNLNKKNDKGITVLMLESQIGGSYEIVEGLLKNKADPNVTDNLGKTALIYAALAGNSVTIEELI